FALASSKIRRMGVVFPNDIWATLLSRNQLRHNFNSRLRIYLSYDLHTSDSADDDAAKAFYHQAIKNLYEAIGGFGVLLLLAGKDWGSREPARAFDEALLCAKLRHAWPILIPTEAI